MAFWKLLLEACLTKVGRKDGMREVYLRSPVLGPRGSHNDVGSNLVNGFVADVGFSSNIVGIEIETEAGVEDEDAMAV